MTRAGAARLVFIALLAACGQSRAPAAASSSSDAQSAAERQEAENWQRMKDCAQRADQMAKLAGWAEGRDGLLGWQNHYSPKFRRCYVQTSRLNASAKKGDGMPPLFDELYDAFEGSLLATCTDALLEKAAFYCSAGNGPGDCRECRAYVNARMKE